MNSLQEVKDHLNITWQDEDTDRKLERIIEDAKSTLNYKIGYNIDYLQSGMEHNLFLNYCMYSWNNCTNEFDTNYFNEIMQLRQKYEVIQYEEDE